MKDGMTVRIARKLSRPVTPAQDKFANWNARLVKKFVTVK